MKVLRWLFAFAVAVLTTAVLGSITQTQFNLSRIAGLGESIRTSTRIEVTLFDLISFAPNYAIIMAVALLIGLLVADWPAARWPGFGRGWFVLAGFVAVITSLLAMNMMLPVTVIGAARTASGIVALSLAGGVGGWVYSLILAQSDSSQSSSDPSLIPSNRKVDR